MKQLNKNSFKRVFGGELPWLVDVYGSDCPACVDFKPEFQQLAKDLKGVVKAADLNSDYASDVIFKYDVSTSCFNK